MASRKAPVPPAVDPLAGGVGTAEEQRLDQILAGLEGEGSVKVSRRDDKGNLRYVGRLPLEDTFSEETVREAFGGGRYYLRFYTNGEYSAGVGMEIEGAPKMPGAGPAPVGAAPAPTAPVATGDHALALEVAQLRGLVAGLTASMQGGGGGGGGLAQLKDVAEIVRSLMPATANPPQGPGSVFEVAREALAFGREVGKDSGDRGAFPWETVVEKGVLPLVDLAREHAARTPGGVPAASGAPTAPAKGAAAVPPGIPTWARYLVAEQGFVVQMAKEEADPDTVADLLLNRWEKKMPAADWDAFQETTQAPGFVDQALALATQYLPGFAPVGAWVRRFLDAVVEQMQPEEPDAPAEDPPVPAGPVIVH